jgi:hypothetical protein
MSRDELLAMILAQQEGAAEVKEERSTGIKLEAHYDANKAVLEDGVEFVSRKRVKCVPAKKDEVIVLD